MDAKSELRSSFDSHLPAGIDPLDVPLWGAPQIGRAMGKTPQAFYHLLRTGQLRGVVQKIGGLYMTTPRALRGLFGRD